MIEPTGYPAFVLYIFILIGLPLSITRPYKVFLVIVFMLASANQTLFTFTRTPYLGAYFNLYDACSLIAISATISSAFFRNKKIEIPNIAKLMLVALLIGFIQSLLILGFDHEVLRALHRGIVLPIYFVIAASIIKDEYDVQKFLFILLIAASFSAIQHIFFVRSTVTSSDLLYNSESQLRLIRSIAFRGPGLWFLIASFIWLPRYKRLNSILIVAIGTLFATSIILNQTRSIWIGAVATLPIVFILFPIERREIRALLLPFVLVVFGTITLFTIRYTTEIIDPSNIVLERVNTLSEENVYSSTHTRQLALERELQEWLGGTLIFGRGLSYFTGRPSYLIAWNHLGHVTTLAQLGLIGWLVYYVFLPIVIIRKSKTLWLQPNQDVKFLGLLTGTAMVASWITFLMSDGFLLSQYTLGIIFGAVWQQANLLEKNNTFQLEPRYRDASLRSV